MSNCIPVVDVFAGCGGLGEGFNILERDGRFSFDVRLCVEKEAAPTRTLETRAFYHLFRGNTLPDCYYEYVSGVIDRDELFQRHPQETHEAKRRCLQAELGSLEESGDRINDSIRQAINGAKDWVLIGGPPCQAYSTIGRARNATVEGYDPDTDVRFELYREYIKIIATHWPAVFVMENVRGLLSASHKNQLIFDRISADLQDPASALAPDGISIADGYEYRLYSIVTKPSRLDGTLNPPDFVVKAEDYGIPQARHRVVILGVRDDISAEPDTLIPASEHVNAEDVLEGLPTVRSGLSSQDDPERWLQSVNKIVKQPWWNDVNLSVQDRIENALSNAGVPPDDRGSLRFLDSPSTCSYRPDWFVDERLTGTLNHQARTHREDDLWRYIYAACYVNGLDRPFRISDFPPGLRPNHRSTESALNNSNFADRFSVVPKHAPSRTVVSHIRKDGHYYIHYDASQCRSLTVREAARLQTFPDNYFFEGSRTDQYGQVGNAVPPLLSYQIAKLVAELLGRNGQPDS